MTLEKPVCSQFYERGACLRRVLPCLVLSICTPVAAQIDLDSPSSTGALTYSRELLSTSTGVPRGFYPVGSFAAADDRRLLTRGTLGVWNLLTSGSGMWIRYDLGEHLVFRGTAPKLFSNRPDPNTQGATIDVLGGGIDAVNAGRFVTQGYLLFSYNPTDGPLPDDTTLELDLANVLATSGQDDGIVRVRAFRTVDDALDATNAFRAAKEATVVRVANTVTVMPHLVTRTATVLEFTQFALRRRVPLGGFEIRIDGAHRYPNGAPLPSGTATDVLRALNVDLAASRVSFRGDGGFAFAPADGGWTIEDVDPETGLCNGEVEATQGAGETGTRAIYPASFGEDDVDYPAGPATVGLPPLAGYLCATVPEDNEHPIEEGEYTLTVVLAAVDGARPFPPSGVSDAVVGTVRREGTAVHIPYLLISETYVPRLAIMNRNATEVDFRLTLQPGKGGTAEPREITGTAAPGVTTLRLADVTRVTGTQWVSATLQVVSNPRLVDVATVTVNRGDQSTDTVVYQGTNRNE